MLRSSSCSNNIIVVCREGSSKRGLPNNILLMYLQQTHIGHTELEYSNSARYETTTGPNTYWIYRTGIFQFSKIWNNYQICTGYLNYTKVPMVVGLQMYHQAPSKLLIATIMQHIKEYCSGIFRNTGYWIISNSQLVIESLTMTKAKSVNTFDFYTLYTTTPHDSMKDDLIEEAFSKRDALYLSVQGRKCVWSNDGRTGVNISKSQLNRLSSK